MADNLAIAAKLDEARALIERPYGWARNDYEVNGAYCTIGAIRKVTSGDPSTWSEDSGCIEHFMRRSIGRCWLDVWNDEPERTQAEVIEAFRKAAELARAEAL